MENRANLVPQEQFLMQKCDLTNPISVQKDPRSLQTLKNTGRKSKLMVKS